MQISYFGLRTFSSTADIVSGSVPVPQTDLPQPARSSGDQSCASSVSGYSERGDDWHGQALEMYKRYSYGRIVPPQNIHSCYWTAGLHELHQHPHCSWSHDPQSGNVHDHAVLIWQTVPPPPQVSVNGSTVPIVNSLTLIRINCPFPLSRAIKVEGLVCRVNCKRYFLAVFCWAGVGAPHLTIFYTVFIRPTLEYVAPVWYPGQTQKLSDGLERVQRLCPQTIYQELSYSKAL